MLNNVHFSRHPCASQALCEFSSFIAECAQTSTTSCQCHHGGRWKIADRAERFPLRRACIKSRSETSEVGEIAWPENFNWIQIHSSLHWSTSTRQRGLTTWTLDAVRIRCILCKDAGGNWGFFVYSIIVFYLAIIIFLMILQPLINLCFSSPHGIICTYETRKLHSGVKPKPKTKNPFYVVSTKLHTIPKRKNVSNASWSPHGYAAKYLK